MPMRRMLILMIAVIGMFGSDAFAIYAPKTGRFMQRDPIGYAGGSMNLYQYVGSNPMKYVDPFGLEPEDPRSQNQREKEVCAALKDAIDNNLSLSDFTKKHSDGTGVGVFNQTHMSVPKNLSSDPSSYRPRSEFDSDFDWRMGNGGSPGLLDVDLDWMIVVAYHNNNPGWIGLLMNDSQIYHAGKTFWVFSESSYFFDGFVDLYNRLYNTGEVTAVEMASRLKNGSVTLDMLYDSFNCDEILCSQDEDSG